MECERKNKWWRGCRFEARYDRVFPLHARHIHSILPATLEACKETRYVCDVCIRCGKTIERGKQA